MATNNMGVDDNAELEVITIIYLSNGLVARVKGDVTGSVRQAKGWKKYPGLRFGGEVWVHTAEVRMMEVVAGTITERPATVNSPAGIDFNPAQLRSI